MATTIVTDNDKLDYELLNRLKIIRSQIAAQEGIELFQVISNRSLEEMARVFPRTMEDLLSIYGIGESKQKTYGGAFLAEIAQYIEEKKACGEEIPDNSARFVSNSVKKIRPVSIHMADPVIPQQVIRIENYEELRAKLESYLAQYQNRAFSPENLRQAISDQEMLKRLRKVLADKRREIKRICLEPIRPAEQQFKELIAMIDAPLKAITAFVGEMEQVRKDDKSSVIKLFYDQHSTALGVLADTVFTKSWFYNPRWENESCPEEFWQEEILQSLERISDDLKAIRDKSGQYTGDVITKYLESGDRKEAAIYLKSLLTRSPDEKQEKYANIDEITDFLNMLSDGIDPFTEESFNTESLKNDPYFQAALKKLYGRYHIADIPVQRERTAKKQNDVSAVSLEGVPEAGEGSISITKMARLLNVSGKWQKVFKYADIASWLVESGDLLQHVQSEKTIMVPTEKGAVHGFEYAKKKNAMGIEYATVFLDDTAQQYILENIDKI